MASSRLAFVCVGITLIAIFASESHAWDYSNNVQDIYGRVRDRPSAVHIPEPAARHRRQHVMEPPRVRRQGGGHEGVTGPVHTYVKTDEHAHFKWGVRHNVGHEYAGRR